MEIIDKAKRAKSAARQWQRLNGNQRNQAITSMAEALVEHEEKILTANEIDTRKAKEQGISGALLDRLTLDSQRIQDMVQGLLDVVAQPDPVGEVLSGGIGTGAMKIEQVRVPLGVIAMIYEARPNVTADATGLCLKAGNAVILRGGSEAINSNLAIASIMRSALSAGSFPVDVVQIIENTDRAEIGTMLRLSGDIDVVIPRGGAGLINFVKENSTIPVIQTGVGNCHVFVDESADLENACAIIDNAKTQRPGVCNALETLLVHEQIADGFLPKIQQRLANKQVELRGCERTKAILHDVVAATEEDWHTEYLDLILAIKVVANVEQAIEHIADYGTGHSDAILTESYANSQQFLQMVDSSAVYVNASTRFTDGAQFGLGAEIGISTQKLHARGPMGLKDLTSKKYLIYGSGNVRS